ncbi:farnesol dehydrogenase-like [Drosophila takahashii]|uniref:farnesol dehydrogenase-like n=1 Tax=Drosophila takahashii TaxID=29030 RepID=UPI0007E63548|nr:farnesol dehydrogenase-like [Drosophila takahashii]
MNRWLNRVAVVTGASAGIGEACCRDLVAKGMVVVGLARREKVLQDIKSSLPADQAARFHTRPCDVSNEQQVKETFAWIDRTLGGADVLINNAGIVRKINLTDEGNSDDVRAILDVNVLGVTWCTRQMFQSLQRRKVNDGHVVIINSVVGHIVPAVEDFSLNMYAPSKHAITALTEILRQEFNKKGTKTKITSVSPGVVDTEIFEAGSWDQPSGMPMLRSADIADAVTYCIQTPPNVQIHELIIKPVGEAF